MKTYNDEKPLKESNLEPVTRLNNIFISKADKKVIRIELIMLCLEQEKGTIFKEKILPAIERLLKQLM